MGMRVRGCVGVCMGMCVSVEMCLEGGRIKCDDLK